jgi:hypothetical protein
MKLHDAARIAMAQTEETRAWFTTDEINAWAEKKLKENPQWTPDWNTEAVEDKQLIDAVATLTEDGWLWDGDQWQRPLAGDIQALKHPKRAWVGLTDENIALIDWESLITKKDCVKAVEAKLRSKNNAT